MKKKILILGGGISKERKISLKQQGKLKIVLKKIITYCRLILTKILKKNLNYLNQILFSMLLHGRFGEDGYAQTVLEYNKVKYTHSGVLSSALAMDKEISKKIFIKNKILTPKFIIFNYNLKNIDNLKITIKKKTKISRCYQTH